MNNAGLLGRTQCWLVSAKLPDVTASDVTRVTVTELNVLSGMGLA